MVDASLEAEHHAAPASVLGRFVGVLLSPRDTFAAVCAEPRWLGIAAMSVGIVVVCVSALLSTEVGRQALLDEQVRAIESFGGEVTDQLYDQLERRLPYAPYIGAGQFLLGMPLVMLIASGILFAVFNAGLAGEATFRQVFAVVAHSFVIVAVGQMFVAPLNYVRESMSRPTNLAVFLPMLEEGGFSARFFGSIDLILVWWVVTLAIGTSVLYGRRTQSVLAAFFGVYLVIALALGIVLSRVGG